MAVRTIITREPAIEPGQLIDGFVFERQLGRGGMAEVWAAKEEGQSKLLALKILLPEFINNEQLRNRFQREGELALRHSNIVPVLKATEIAGRPTLVMPLYSGGSLETRIRSSSEEQESGVGKPLPLEDVLSISKDILAALNHAHEKGTIHRDVKPANILFDDEGRAYLSDFGTATEMKRILVTRYAGGTPLWTSPEQIRGSKNVRHLADVYSFGCCMYDMLAGRPPFDADEEDDQAWVFAVQTKHVNETPMRVALWNPAVPPALDELVFKSLAKKPEERIPGCGEFLRLLKEAEPEILGLEPVQEDLPEPPKPEPIKKGVWYRRTGVIAAAAVGFLIYLALLYAFISRTGTTKISSSTSNDTSTNAAGVKPQPNDNFQVKNPGSESKDLQPPTGNGGTGTPHAKTSVVPGNNVAGAGQDAKPTKAEKSVQAKSRKDSVQPPTRRANQMSDSAERPPETSGGVQPGYHTVGDNAVVLTTGEVRLAFRDQDGSPVQSVNIDSNGTNTLIRGSSATINASFGRVHLKISKPGYEPVELSVDVSSTPAHHDVRLIKIP